MSAFVTCEQMAVRAFFQEKIRQEAVVPTAAMTELAG